MTASFSINAKDAAERIHAAIGGRPPRASGSGYVLCCPAHDDKTASFSLGNSATTGNLLWKCFAGCSQDVLLHKLRSLGVLPDVSYSNNRANGLPKGILYNWLKKYVYRDMWTYADANGEIIGYTVRYDHPTDGSKQVIPYFKHKNGAWASGIPDEYRSLRLLYGVGTLAIPGDVYIFEGEKKAAIVHRFHMPAVSVMGGKEGSKHMDWSPLKGRNVIIWPDYDIPGDECAADIIRALQGVAATISVIDVDALNPDFKGWDIDDYAKRERRLDANDIELLPTTTIADYMAAAKARRATVPTQATPATQAITSESESIISPVDIPTGHNGQPLTDVGNSHRLAIRHGHNIRYAHEWQRWIVWDGKRWAPDDNGALMRMAKDTANAIRTEELQEIYEKMAAAQDRQEHEKYEKLAAATLKWANISESEARLRAMISVASVLESILVKIDKLDAHKNFLNCLNGTVDMKTLTVMPHQREHLITKIIPIKYNPDAKAEIWDQYFNRVQPVAEMRHFLQTCVGYSAIGTSREHKVFIHHGGGKNGKSTFINNLGRILGSGYYQKANNSLFSEQSTDKVRNDLARLVGARMVTLSETPDNMVLDEALLKAASGGDLITTRFLHKEFFEFMPVFTVHIDTNNKPRIRGQDDGIWRRLVLIPWEVSIPTEEIDNTLDDKLKADEEGILKWIIDGAHEYLMNGLMLPDTVIKASLEYRSAEDILGDWFSSCIVKDNNAAQSYADLMTSYNNFCTTNNMTPLKKPTWEKRLIEHGAHKSVNPITGVVTWIGVGLKADASYADAMNTLRQEHVDRRYN